MGCRQQGGGAVKVDVRQVPNTQPPPPQPRGSQGREGASRPPPPCPLVPGPPAIAVPPEQSKDQK